MQAPSQIGLAAPEDSGGYKIEREAVGCVWDGMWGQPGLRWCPSQAFGSDLELGCFGTDLTPAISCDLLLTPQDPRLGLAGSLFYLWRN